MDEKYTKFQNIPLEDAKLDTPYAFSFNPEHQTNLYDKKSDSFQYTYALVKMDQYMKKMLVKLKASAYLMYQELSPLGRIHYHGYIQILNIVDFFVYDVPLLKSYGTFCIKPIDDAALWAEYVRKQQAVLASTPLRSLLYSL